MSDEGRLSRSTAAWSGDDVPGSRALGDATTVDGRPGGARGGGGFVSDRYQIVGDLGRGGMAVVHAAFDRQLGRRVALKLVRPDRLDPGGRARLLREAQAMARLRHPNVVQVFDAGTAGDQVYVSMELIDGGSLTHWLATAERTWRQIVDVFIGAGRGLAAAHAAGLVHRDFKPDNVLIDRDGVAHVADFGLAVGGTEPEVSTADAPALLTVTTAGLLIGTPAYMAPEQLDGGTATAASDQFAFCVALHRALHGVAPFAGDSPTTLRQSIAGGTIQEAPSAGDLPRWLRAAVQRGLAAEPGARHASMESLLGLLARPRGWRRWRMPLLGGVAVLTSGAAVALALRSDPRVDPTAACDGGQADLAPVWNPTKRAHVTSALAAAPAALRSLVLSTIDRRIGTWTATHRAACVAHARGAESAVLLDRHMGCLRQRRFELAAAIDQIAQLNRDELPHASELVASLAPATECADPEFVTRELPPPPTAAGRVRSDQLRRELARIDAADRAGRSEPALAALAALLPQVRATADPGLLVDALVTAGRIAQVRMEFVDAAAQLREAESIALRSGAIRAAVEAGARRLFVEAMEGSHVEQTTARGEVFESLASSLHGDTFAVPLLLNNLGAMHMARGETDAARQYFARAKQVVDATAEPRLELLVVDRNLALTTTGVTSERLAQQTLDNLRTRVGADNPMSLEAAATAAHLTRDPRRAVDLILDLAPRFAAFQPTAVEFRQREARHGAFLATEIGDTTTARTLLAEAASLRVNDQDPILVATEQLAIADLALLDGRLDTARDAYVAANAVLLASANWWDREFGAAGLVGLATIARARGDDRTAMRQLDLAIAIYVDVTAKGNNQDPMRRLARARVMRAELARAHGDANLAALLDAAALAYYRSTESPAYADLIARLTPR